MIPGYRSGYQQDATEFLNGFMDGINDLFTKQRSGWRQLCIVYCSLLIPQRDKPSTTVYWHRD